MRRSEQNYQHIACNASLLQRAEKDEHQKVKMKVRLIALIICVVGYNNSWATSSCITAKDVVMVKSGAVDLYKQVAAKQDAMYISAVSGVVEGFHTGNMEINMQFADAFLDVAAKNICGRVETFLPDYNKGNSLDTLGRIRDIRKSYPRLHLGSNDIEEKARELDKTCLDMLPEWGKALPVSKFANVKLPTENECMSEMQYGAYIAQAGRSIDRHVIESASKAAIVLADLIEANHSGELKQALEEADHYMDEQSLLLCEWLDEKISKNSKIFIIGRLKTVEKIRSKYKRLYNISTDMTKAVDQCFKEAKELTQQYE